MDFNNNERNNQDPNKRKKNKTNLLICLMAALFAIGLIFFLNSEIQRNTEKEITYTKFIEMLKKDQVKKVTFTWTDEVYTSTFSISGNRLTIKDNEDSETYTKQ